MKKIILSLLLLFSITAIYSQEYCEEAQQLTVQAEGACNTTIIDGLGKDFDDQDDGGYTNITSVTTSCVTPVMSWNVGWYSFTGTGNPVTIKMLYPNKDVNIVIFENTPCGGDMTEYACFQVLEDVGGGIVINTTNGASYTIAIYRDGGSSFFGGEIAVVDNPSGTPYSLVCDPCVNGTPHSMLVHDNSIDCFDPAGYTDFAVAGHDTYNGVNPIPYDGCTAGDPGRYWDWGVFTAVSDTTNLYVYGQNYDGASFFVTEGPCSDNMIEVVCGSTGDKDFGASFEALTTPGTEYYVFYRDGSSGSIGRVCAFWDGNTPDKPFCDGGLSFEDGTTDGWNAYNGSYHLASAPGFDFVWDMSSGMTGNRFELVSSSYDPLIGNVLPRVAPGGGNYSFRIGSDANQTDPISGVTFPGSSGEDQPSAEEMSYTFTVDPNNAGFGIKYATVMNFSDHIPEVQPTFEVVVYNDAGDTIDCANYSLNPTDGYTQYYSPGDDNDVINPGTQGTIFSPWQDIATDLSGYAGQQVTVDFRVKDCHGNASCGSNDPSCSNWCANCQTGTCQSCLNAGSHFAYAYFDTYCSPMNIDIPEFCAGDAQIEICAPAGYASYSWPTGQPGAVAPFDEQCLTINNPQAGDVYTVNMITLTGCSVTRTIPLFEIPAATTDTIFGCAGENHTLEVTPTNTSNTYTYEWSDGGGTNSTFDITTPSSDYTWYCTVTNSATGCSSVFPIVFIYDCGPSVTLTVDDNQICENESVVLTTTVNGGTPPYTYEWSHDPSETGAGPLTVSPPVGTTTYTVTVTDASGTPISVISNTVTVNVTALPTFTISSTDPTACAVSDGTITISGLDANTTYNISYNSGTPTAMTTDGSGNIVITDLGAGSYTNIIVDINGCSTTYTQSISLVEPNAPTVVASATETTICNGESTQISATNPDGATITWDNGVPNGIGPHTVSPNTTTTYTVTAIKDGCESNDVVTITVNPLPTVDGGSDQTACYGESITLTATGTTGATFTWNDSIQDGISFHPSPGDYTCTVTASLLGCEATDEVNISIGSLLTVNVNSDLSSICPTDPGNDEAQFTAIPNGGVGPYTYQWAGLSLSDINIYNPIASPSNIGNTNNYTVTVTDDYGCTAVGYINLYVGCGPIPIIYTSEGDTGSATICLGQGLKLFCSVSAGTQPYNIPYSWTGLTPTYSSGTIDGSEFHIIDIPTTLAAGTYDYSVEVTDAASDNGIGYFQLTVLPLPNATADAGSDADICLGDTVTLDASGSYAVPPASLISWEWSNLVTGVTQEVNPTTTTSYTVTVTDNNNCWNTDEVIITVNNLPSVTDITIDSLDCFGDADATITATVSGTSDFSYTWSNNGTIIRTEGPTVSATDVLANQASGTYLFEVSDGNGCSIDSLITIIQPEEVIVSYTKTDISCNGQTDGQIYTVVTGGTSPYTYTWIPASSEENLTDLEAGLYILFVRDANNCEDSVSVNIIEPDSITIDQVDQNNVSCYGFSDASIEQVISGGTGNYTYLWSNGSTGKDITFIGAGIYHVTITDANGCEKDTSYTISQPTEIVITGTVDDNGDDQHAPKANIDVEVSGGSAPYSYNWSNGETNQDIGDLIDGEYIIIVIDSINCSATDTFIVKLPLFIPTVITPNGDGDNDTWEITGIAYYNEVEINIFNRWGDKVYSYEGSGSGYSAEAWNGTWQKSGKEVDFGTYVWVITLVDDNNHQEKGTITVIR